MLLKILIIKLRNVYWIVKFYLSSGTQYVSKNNTKSESLFIKCGVPQGSVFGPILFLMT